VHWGLSLVERMADRYSGHGLSLPDARPVLPRGVARETSETLPRGSRPSQHRIHTRIGDECLGAERRKLHDFTTDWFTTRGSSMRYHTLGVLHHRCCRYGMLAITCWYLVLVVTSMMLDSSLVCVNARHRMVEDSAVRRIRNTRKPGFLLSPLMVSTSSRRNGDQFSAMLSPVGRLDTPLGIELLEASDFENVLLCDPLYAREASATAWSVNICCLCLVLVMLLEHLLRLCSMGPLFFIKDGWLGFDFCLVTASFACDLVIVFVLRPVLERAYRNNDNADGTMWVIFLCRVWRLTLAWRLVRWLRAERTLGVEVRWISDAIRVMQSEHGGMANARILGVQAIKNSSSELKAYESKLYTMRKQQSEVREQLFFFGSSTLEPHVVIEHWEDVDAHLVEVDQLGGVLHGAERPVYSDCCSAFTDWEQDPTGKTRQLFVFRALVGKAQEMDHDELFFQLTRNTSSRGDMSLMSSHTVSFRASSMDGTPSNISKPKPGFDCLCIESPAPFDYLPIALGVKERDVRSKIHAFHEHRGQALLVGLVTYQNPDAFVEIDKMLEIGAKSWQDWGANFQNIAQEDPELTDAKTALAQAIDCRDVEAFRVSEAACRELGVPDADTDRIKLEKKSESEDAGVSLAHLLSHQFQQMSCAATRKADPTFLDMKEPFWMTGQARIGERLLCPRDLQPGCALIDTLSHENRQTATDFLSWVWGYPLSTVQSGLGRWSAARNMDPAKVFLYMCFFCNNQWRIFVQKSFQGSDNLEITFEARLRTIGKMVVLMDSWDDALYLRRIWTIFEQYIATKCDIDVMFTLPELPAATLIEQLDRGKEGIHLVIQAVSMVDSERAEASVKEDEIKVKNLIRKDTGFERVNDQVKSSITEWIAGEFKANIDTLVKSRSSITEMITEGTKDR